MNRLYLSFLFFITTSILLSQNTEIDSLIRVLDNARDTSRIEILIELTKKYDKIGMGEAHRYCNQALLLSKEIDNKGWEGISYLNLGILFFDQGKYENALTNFNNSYEAFEIVDKKIGMAGALNNMAAIFQFQGDYGKAMVSYKKALKARKDLGDKDRVVASLINIGGLFQKMGNDLESIKYQLQAYELTRNKFLQINICLNIGDSYKRLKYYEKAINYTQKALNLSLETGDTRKLADSYNMLGSIYSGLKEYQKALDFLLKSQEVRIKIDDKKGERTNFSRIAFVYYQQGEYKEALKYYLNCLELAKEMGLKPIISSTLIDLGKVYNKQGKTRLAISSINEGLSIAQEINNKPKMIMAYFNLAKVYENNSNYKEAYKYHILYTELQDSVFNKNKIKELGRIESLYELEGKDKENELLKKEKEIISRDKEIQLFRGKLLIGLAILLFLAVALIYIKLSTSRKLLQKEREVDQMKSRFFTNISHEIRTPLTLISGIIKQLSEQVAESKHQDLLKTALKNGNRLHQLINQLLDITKLESGKMQLSVVKDDLIPFLKGIVMSFESLAIQKNIKLKFSSKFDNLEAYIDHDKINKIFYNLLSNAIKFSENGGVVSVDVFKENERVRIMVKDNGVGIPEDKLPFIFDRFYQADNTSIKEFEGSGIGLSLVKSLIHLHRGELFVSSLENKGTTFTIYLPLGNSVFEVTEIKERKSFAQEETTKDIEESIDSIKTVNIEETDENNELKVDNSIPSLLVIEDNPDLQYFIKQYLENKYNIISAYNGVDGIELAKKHLPDLIISDIMMPKKNGYEVSEIIKNDPKTSHIPLILLTAKASQEEKLEGLETGADDFLVKPFDIKELSVRVRNLIELRKKLRLQFADAIELKVEDVATNQVDKSFLDKAVEILEEHIQNQQFSVDFLASTVNMSYYQLNKKLQALTGQSVNKFIQSFRLQKGKGLLMQGSLNVSEIALEVGFSSTAYFVKCFREKYGKSPGAYLEHMKSTEL